jgi:hypothetical protein
MWIDVSGVRGYEFERVVSDLFLGLDYEVLYSNRQIPCSCVGRHRKENLHEFDLLVVHRKRNLLRPAFSPDGPSVVESKSWSMRDPVVVNDLVELVECVNECGKYGSIKGAILLSGKSMSQDVILRAEETGTVYCWDLNRLLFYASKLLVLDDLETWAELEPDSKIVEESRVEHEGGTLFSTKLTGLRPRIAEKRHQLRLEYFCDTPVYELHRPESALGLSGLAVLGSDFFETIQMMRGGSPTFPVEVDVGIHSLTGFKTDVKRQGRIYVKSWERSLDDVRIESLAFYDYDLAPWHALLRETILPPERIITKNHLESLLVRVQAQALRRAAERVLPAEDERYVRAVLDRFRKTPPHIPRLTWWSDIHPDVEVAGRHIDLYVHYRPRWPFFIPTLAFVLCNREKRPVAEKDLFDVVAFARLLKDEKRVMRVWAAVASVNGFSEDALKYCSEFEKRDIGLVLVDTKNWTSFTNDKAQSRNAANWLKV